MTRPAHRPPLPPGERRDARVVVQVKPDMAEEWQKAAEARGVTRSALIRDAVEAYLNTGLAGREGRG